MRIPSNIQMIIYDMAGTVINEKGLVYKTLYDTMNSIGLNITDSNIHNWYGRDKHEVLNEELKNTFPDDDEIEFNKKQKKLYTQFEANLIKNYFKPGNISLMNEQIPDMFNDMRKNYYKITLNTYYPNYIQKLLVNKLGLDKCVDSYIASNEVCKDRPLYYMIHTLMERHNIRHPSNVMKVSNTIIDIDESVKTKCGETIGVLTGVGTEEDLYNSGATHVVNSIIDLEYNDI